MKAKTLILFLCVLNVSIFSQNPYYGELNLVKTYYYFDTITLDSTLRNYDISKATRFMASGVVYSDSVRYPQPWLITGEGNLKYNGVSLNFSPLMLCYHDTIERKENTSQYWEYEHEDESKNFTVSIGNEMPSLSLKHILPESVSISNGFTIEYGSVSNADSVQVLIIDYNAENPFPITKTVGASNPSLTFASEEIEQVLNKNTNVIVSFIKEDETTVNEKTYKISKRYNIIRPVAFIE